MAISVTLNKADYTPGDPMTLTVVCDPEDRDRYITTPFTVNVNVPGTGSGAASANLILPTDDAPVIINDPERTWTVRSDDGVTLIADATA